MTVAEKKKIIGLIENVTLKGTIGQTVEKAKIDTGASRTSVDSKIAGKVGLGPIVSAVRIKSLTTKRVDRRPLAQARLIIAGMKFDIAVSVADRKEMKYRVLIGMDILKSGCFLIDPSKLDEHDKIT